MSLLLDTHILLAIVDTPRRLPSAMEELIRSGEVAMSASVASLWEIAIKDRLGKLPMRTSPQSLPDALAAAGIGILPIDQRHVLAELDAEPATRDPFDRLLLAQCQVEGMRLVTIDRALVALPLAWREA
jgi:PIN domain nuclease of toxin-antitoxin system